MDWNAHPLEGHLHIYQKEYESKSPSKRLFEEQKNYLRPLGLSDFSDHFFKCDGKT